MTASELERFAAANALNLWLEMRRATTLLVRTQRAGPPPAGWSDLELVTQRLDVAVEETLCGPAPDTAALSVELPVVQGARTSSPSGGLAEWLTSAGARFVLLLEDGRLADEDLGALPATDALVERVRAACSAPPPGLGTMLQLVAEAAERDADVRAPFTAIPDAVVDVTDPTTGEIVRLTVAAGQLRVFAGIRAERVARTRPPDARASMSAADLAALLLDGAAAEAGTDDRGVIAALAAAGGAIRARPELRDAIARAA